MHPLISRAAAGQVLWRLFANASARLRAKERSSVGARLLALLLGVADLLVDRVDRPLGCVEHRADDEDADRGQDRHRRDHLDDRVDHRSCAEHGAESNVDRPRVRRNYAQFAHPQGDVAPSAPISSTRGMAKDTEKLIRQLSLISFLMANRRPGVGARDQAGGRGLQLDERGCVRAPLLRRPRRAREPRDLAPGREAGRGLLRGRALRAAARELLPAGDRVHRRRAGGAAHRARPARRRVRLRRAAAAGAAAGLLGPAEPAHRAATTAPIDVKLSTASAGGRELSQRLAKIETAISRRKTIEFTYYSMQRDDAPTARSTPTTSSSATASSI